MAAPMMMNLSHEDARTRCTTFKLGPECAWASEEYDKESKNAKVVAITRYRYVITVEARGQTSDQAAVVKSLAEAAIRRFADK